MTGAQHYHRAEGLLALADRLWSDDGDLAAATLVTRQAQVHATLALAAAHAMPAVPGTYGRERTQ